MANALKPAVEDALADMAIDSPTFMLLRDVLPAALTRRGVVVQAEGQREALEELHQINEQFLNGGWEPAYTPLILAIWRIFEPQAHNQNSSGRSDVEAAVKVIGERTVDGCMVGLVTPPTSDEERMAWDAECEGLRERAEKAEAALERVRSFGESILSGRQLASKEYSIGIRDILAEARFTIHPAIPAQPLRVTMGDA